MLKRHIVRAEEISEEIGICIFPEHQDLMNNVCQDAQLLERLALSTATK